MCCAGAQAGRESAVAALWSMTAVNDRVKVAMVEEGAVGLLVDMLGKGANRQVEEYEYYLLILPTNNGTFCNFPKRSPTFRPSLTLPNDPRRSVLFSTFS